MKDIEVINIKEPVLHEPIMIEGLPGVGHVGKLVAEHMIEELKAEKIMEISSPHFPPQVLVLPDGSVRLIQNEIYVWKSKKLDLLILVGDYQSATNTGHYILANFFLDIAQKYKVKRIYTLGGYGVGHLTDTQEVIGVVNDIHLINQMKKYGVEFKENEPEGGVFGVSGLLLGLAKMRNIEGVCLMGVTSGYLVDPKSAQEVLGVLCKILDIDIDMHALVERANEMEKIIKKIKKMESMAPPMGVSEEDLGYIR
jgi:hypothetical protein